MSVRCGYLSQIFRENDAFLSGLKWQSMTFYTYDIFIFSDYNNDDRKNFLVLFSKNEGEKYL